MFLLVLVSEDSLIVTILPLLPIILPVVQEGMQSTLYVMIHTLPKRQYVTKMVPTTYR